MLDELQDLTDNLYWLASTFIASIARSTGKYPAILALGDSRQAIFDFQGADSRFLEKAETVFQPFSDRDWKSLSLSHSFRLTRPTADFINNAWLGGEQYILGTGDGPKPLYIRANLWETEAIFDKLWPHIKQYKPDKCAILAPSIRIKKHCHPLKLLENKLSSFRARTFRCQSVSLTTPHSTKTLYAENSSSPRIINSKEASATL